MNAHDGSASSLAHALRNALDTIDACGSIDMAAARATLAAYDARADVVIYRNGQAVSSSRNLRGVLRYRADVVDVAIWAHVNDSGATLVLRWSDGATCTTRFADIGVCVDWCARRRAWPRAVVHE